MGTHIHPKHLTSKRDLAMAYFPNLKPETAERKFRRWIHKNFYLMKMLKNQNYKIFQKKLTNRQLHAIFDILGTPEADIFSKHIV